MEFGVCATIEWAGKNDQNSVRETASWEQYDFFSFGRSITDGVYTTTMEAFWTMLCLMPSIFKVWLDGAHTLSVYPTMAVHISRLVVSSPAIGAELRASDVVCSSLAC